MILLSVPAGEDSLTHRRHVCSRVIPHSQDSLTNGLDLEKIFGRKAPLHVDLGCGDGSFLCALAQRLPVRNFLGIERLTGRIRSSARKAANLENVRLLQIESSYAVRYLLPEGSVETFYLLFPDPWPKRRHHRRRIVTNDFLGAIHRALTSDGSFLIATDQLDYFQQIQRVATSDSRFHKIEIEREVSLPLTKFERGFRDQGTSIYRLSLRKISPVR